MVTLYTDEFNVISVENGYELQVPQTEIEDSQGRHIVLKARVKVAGRVWTVHKNDADPFPSNPHAHNVEDGSKLNLHSGEIFRDKLIIGRVSEKALTSIQNQLRTKDFQI